MILIVAVLVASSFIFGWFLGVKTDPVLFSDFVKQYEATQYKGTKFKDFKDQYQDKKVVWDGEIRELYPDSKQPAYWIEPPGTKPQLIDRFHFLFQPSEFNPLLEKRSKVRVRAQIKVIGPSSVILDDCEILHTGKW